MATYEITANGAPVACIEHNHPKDAMVHAPAGPGEVRSLAAQAAIRARRR